VRGERLERPAIADHGHRLARGERRARRLESHEILAARDDPHGDRLLALLEFGALDVERGGVEPQDRRRAAEAQVDADLAREAGVRGIDREAHGVVDRRGVVAEAELGRLRIGGADERGGGEGGAERATGEERGPAIHGA